MLHKKAHGFSLIELMVVIAIMGVIGALAYGCFREFRNQAWDMARQREILKIADIMQTFYDENGYIPDSTDGPGVCAIGQTNPVTGKVCLGEVFAEIQPLFNSFGFMFYFDFEDASGKHQFILAVNRALFPLSNKYRTYFLQNGNGFWPNAGFTPIHFWYTQSQFRKDCMNAPGPAACPNLN